jgi:RNA polymerase sigma factor (sigma-70 family)
VKDDDVDLAERFDASRPHLQSVAYRMLGSLSEAEDAVQEAWIRLNRSDAGEVGNLGGWLTTVVARICLDMLRARESRREEPLEEYVDSPAEHGSMEVDVDKEMLLAESLGSALLVVLDALSPAERLAFVLHDLFAVPFEEIARILGRSPGSARQLASRARRRVQGQATSVSTSVPRGFNHDIVDAFLAASRGGDFAGLLALLDPDVVVRADAAAIRMGAFTDVRGARAVAEKFAGRAQGAQPVVLDGQAGAVWVHTGKPRMAFQFGIRDGKVIAITMIADPEYLGRIDLGKPW